MEFREKLKDGLARALSITDGLKLKIYPGINAGKFFFR
jgi:hypothetical protein